MGSFITANIKQNGMDSLKQKDVAQIQELLIRIDRNNTIIEKLSVKLNSYTCEPHDSSCFEKFYNLKHSFKQFNTHQKRIVGILKSKSTAPSALDIEINQHLKRFKKLEKDMAAYLLDTNQYF